MPCDCDGRGTGRDRGPGDRLAGAVDVGSGNGGYLGSGCDGRGRQGSCFFFILRHCRSPLFSLTTLAARRRMYNWRRAHGARSASTPSRRLARTPATGRSTRSSSRLSSLRRRSRRLCGRAELSELRWPRRCTSACSTERTVRGGRNTWAKGRGVPQVRCLFRQSRLRMN